MLSYPIETGPAALPVLIRMIEEWSPSALFVLTDDNTKEHCYPRLKEYLPGHFHFSVPAGERHKQLSTCEVIWSTMTTSELDRGCLVINLGGGVLGDMGGFCAATFKRGVRFVQVPTTLLAMVDASVGGKLGIDFEGLKNHLGVFSEPMGVFIDPEFLRTLPVEELCSGFAEVIKHHLIADGQGWRDLQSLDPESVTDWQPLIRHSVGIKSKIVSADLRESGLRKILNFGHTIGHALESFCMDRPRPLLHGEAIAAGMISEAWLSYQRGWLNEEDLEEIRRYIFRIYPDLALPSIAEVPAISELARQDKKNRKGQIEAALLNGIGRCHTAVPVSQDEIESALSFTIENQNS